MDVSLDPGTKLHTNAYSKLQKQLRGVNNELISRPQMKAPGPQGWSMSFQFHLVTGVFGPLKIAYREQVEQLYRRGANTIGKQHLTLLYSRARNVAFIGNIKSGWSKTGLFPFNPDKFLQEKRTTDQRNHSSDS